MQINRLVLIFCRLVMENEQNNFIDSISDKY